MEAVIGISGNEMTIHRDGDATAFEINYSPRYFSQVISENQGVPIIIPITDIDYVNQYVSMIDGLLLAGGQDISPQFYGEEPRQNIGLTSLERDNFEIALLQEAIRQNKAILAVCRGMQLVNIVFGGNLYQDLSENPQVTLQHVQKSSPHNPTHSIEINPTSKLYQIVGQPDNNRIQVNSYHHQMIHQLGRELIATAYSMDQVIEAVESQNDQHDIIGVQWHPELLKNYPHSGSNLFSNLIERAKKVKLA